MPSWTADELTIVEQYVRWLRIGGITYYTATREVWSRVSRRHTSEAVRAKLKRLAHERWRTEARK